ATPELFVTYASRWVYWHNARAAWSLKLAALVECRRRPDRSAMDRPFVLDARRMSLAAIDRLLLAEAGRTGDFRLAACAPGATLGAAPLPGEPFSPEKFAGQLDRAFDQLIGDEHRFVLDVSGKRALLPGMLWACRKMVRERYQAEYGSRHAVLLTALRPYVGRAGRARLEQALGYTPVERPRLVELAIPRRKVFHPGKVGRAEP
ncbi:hypothetical protein LCGC14_1905060, partial [marine sediment metagenome]